jgi:2-keto-4-pentenoate hydratase/2-oxohepta-3-ene-1,7-dioic acid hydratase in catechol pathway
MKIVAFDRKDGAGLGIVEGDTLVDLTAVDPGAPRELGAALRAGSLESLAGIARRAVAAQRFPLSSLSYRMPVETPGKIICLGLNYVEHVAEGPYQRQEYPTLFMRCMTSLVPHDVPLVRPRASEKFDYEAELVAVIGKRCRDLTMDNALSVVAGYSCFNDGSIRDFQRHTVQWTMGKNFDRSGSFGPFFVSADELPPGAAGLKIECRLSGQTVQSDNTKNMSYPVAETLVYVTQGITLEPGDLLVMGTPSGVGHGRKPPLWMKAGDTIEVEIEKVGLLRNRIVDEG